MLHTFCLAAFIHHHGQHVKLAAANESCIAPVAMQCTVKLILKHPAAAAMASSTTSWAWRFPASTRVPPVCAMCCLHQYQVVHLHLHLQAVPVHCYHISSGDSALLAGQSIHL